MSQANVIEIVVAVVCVLLASLMTAGEAALQAFSRPRAEALAKERGSRAAGRLVEIMQDKAPYLNTSLFVRVLLEVLAIVLVTIVVTDHIEDAAWQVAWSAGVMVVVSFILLGVAPRTMGRQHADAVALAASGPLSLLTTVLGPIPQVMIVIGNMITPGRGYADGPFTSEAELRELLDRAGESDLIEDDERKMIHSVFDLGDTIVKEVMVPRTSMVYVEQGKTLRQGLSLALRSGFSRIPVIGEDLDDVLGIFYLKDAIRRTYDHPRAEATETVESVMRPPVFVPDSKPVDELLRELQLTHTHVVIVVDEFGGTAGLATIEDILEEIVGEIVDEYDANEVPPYVKLDEDRYRVSSRLALDDLGDLFDLELDDDDVDTVLGLMAKELNKVPIPGTVVEWGGLELTAERASGRRNSVQTVLATRIRRPEAEPGAEGTEASADGEPAT
nr:HlyC/CorC family transporter [Propionibacterium sp.]